MPELTFKKISKELFSLSIPMALTQLIAVSSGFISMVMLSSLGPDVLAASALIFSTRISILVIGSSILFALSILIGHAYGEREYLRIGNFMQQGWCLSLLLCLPVMVLFWNLDSILLFFGQSKLLVGIIKDFFHANIWNVLPFFLSVCNQQLCYGTRKQRIDLVANLLGVGVLLLSAYLLIFGKFGFPVLGVKGLGYALNLQGWFYFLFTGYVIYSSDFFKRFDLFTIRLHKSLNDLKHLFKISWPICIQIGGEMFSFIMGATMVGWLGVQSLAAYQVVIQYLILIVVPLFALSQASGVLVGQAFGEKNYLKINKIGQAGVLFSFVISLIAAGIFILFPKQLASLYLNVNTASNAEILHLIVILFVIIAVFQMVDGIRNVITGSLRGLFDTQFPMYIGLLAIWAVGIPLGYLLGFTFSLGVPGLLVGSTIGMLLGMGILLFRWQKLNKQFYLNQ
jgi:MATE family multidrug resistance protein